MKIMFKIIVLSVGILFILNSCGESGDKWGIDHQASTNIPLCDGDKDTTTNAIRVYKNQEIQKLNEHTTIRLWHYQNGDKLVCVVAGEAVIKYEK